MRSKRRTWPARFRDAFRGWKFGVRGQASFAVHFFVATLVVLTAFLLGCAVWEWCVLIGCIGGVLTTELFNSSIEMLFRELPEDIRDRAWPALDIAAGAVLMVSLTAGILGLIILLPRLVARFGGT